MGEKDYLLINEKHPIFQLCSAMYGSSIEVRKIYLLKYECIHESND